MKPVARLLKYIGTDLYPARLAADGRVVARSYSELEDGMYADTWEKVSELYTTDQLRQAKVEVLREALATLPTNTEGRVRKHLVSIAAEIERSKT